MSTMLFATAIYILGAISGAAITLCIGALLGARDPHDADTEYL